VNHCISGITGLVLEGMEREIKEPRKSYKGT